MDIVIIGHINYLNKFKCIIFDFDGVVVKSNTIKKNAFYDIWGISLSISDKDKISQIILQSGDRFDVIPKIYDFLKKGYVLKADIETYLDLYNAIVEKEIIKTGIRNDIHKIIEKYKKKLLLINSATPEKQLIDIIKKVGLNKYIRECKGTPLNKYEIFQYYLSKYKLKKKEVIFIGDSNSDYLISKQIGIKFLGVLSTESDLLAYNDLDFLIKD